MAPSGLRRSTAEGSVLIVVHGKAKRSASAPDAVADALAVWPCADVGLISLIDICSAPA